MTLSGWDKDASPYHPGEQALHERLGRKERQEQMGRQIHRPYMPDQHRNFFAQLPFVVAGSVDDTGAPWASILFGKPGFISTPDPKAVSISGGALPGDPIIQNAQPGAPVSFVGIELPTRRRNRINGVVREAGEAMLVDVVQSYGNCPQYIHTRQIELVRDPETPIDIEIETFTDLSEAAARVIQNADTLFVASNNPRDDKWVNGGVDVNHRGGQPGFVKIDGNTLTVPDFIGNFAFNTLGNFMVNPKAGLLFIDFETGDLVQLTGRVELLLDKTDEVAAFRGAERAWTFTLEHGQRMIGASPLQFVDGQVSPNARLTGNWDEAAQALRAQASRLEWRAFRVARIEDESDEIRSFYLEPQDGLATLPYKPGQYLTIRATPDGTDQPQVRTYTLSSAPSDEFYRISVKREPDGFVSKHLHDVIETGDLIDTHAPLGSFWLDTEEQRPAVLLAGGVGITPMVAMARQVVTDGFARRNLRPLTVIHSARTTAVRAFMAEFTALQKATEGQLRYVSVISAPATGETAGNQFHAAGRVSPAMLQSLLPIADYDFYLCGPSAFMQSVYDMLIGLGIRDARIFAETFGPSTLERMRDPSPAAPVTPEAKQAVVTYAASGVEQGWTPEDGTLLEHAEAHGLTPAYGCRSGACGTCAVRLKSGAVAYREKPDFPPEEGDVLICCAVPAAEGGAPELDL